MNLDVPIGAPVYSLYYVSK